MNALRNCLARLLKETAMEVAAAVTLLFQALLDRGKVPTFWKEDSRKL